MPSLSSQSECTKTVSTGLIYAYLIVLFKTYSTVQYSTVQCSAVQCSAVQCSAVQYSTVDQCKQYSHIKQYSRIYFCEIEMTKILVKFCTIKSKSC